MEGLYAVGSPLPVTSEGHNGPVIVDTALYRDGRRYPCADLSDELAALRGQPVNTFVWIGLKDPTQEEFDLVKEELDLHPLAIEDALRGNQRAKVEVYDDVVFVVVKPLRYLDATSDIETGELMVFVGEHVVLTVRRGEASPLTGVRARLEARPDLLALGPMSALHGILDSIVDSYQLIDAEVAQDLEEIEAAVFTEGDVETPVIYRLKREVLEFRRAVVPMAEPLTRLHRELDSPVTDPELRLQFRDVSDHLHGVLDHIDGYDRLLTDILSAHLAQVSVKQNSDMRKISAWVAIAAVPTMIAGIYGMNFEHMPELSWRFGYGMVLALMATACGLMYRGFKKSGWL